MKSLIDDAAWDELMEELGVKKGFRTYIGRFTAEGLVAGVAYGMSSLGKEDEDADAALIKHIKDK